MASYTLVKKPLTMTGVFARGWDIFTSTFWSVVPYSFMLALFSLPGHVAQKTTVQKTETAQSVTENAIVAGKGSISTTVDSMRNTSDAITDATNQLSVHISSLSSTATFLMGVVVFLILLFMLFVIFGFYAAMIKQMDSSVKGKKLNFIAGLFAGFGQSFTMLGAFFLAGIAVALGFILLVLPGIYIGVALFFAPLLPIVENLSIKNSLKESMRLVSGHWWRVFFSLFIVGLVIGLFQLLVWTVLGIVFAASSPDVLDVSKVPLAVSSAVSIVLILTQTVILPLLYSFYLSILYDLQSRKIS